MNLRICWRLICTAVAAVITVAAVLFVWPSRSARADSPVEHPATTTILVVRHADRAGSADSLSAAGLERAQALCHAAMLANVTAIYHSDTRRTRDTAAALAQALRITPAVYPAKDVKRLIEGILRDHAGETVLVVGHSNTVPMIIAAAGGPVMADIDEREYDGLFVLEVPDRGGPARLTVLQYGKPSP